MICPKCGLPEELCVCSEVTKEEQRIRVYSDRRKFGKTVTIIDGFEGTDIQGIATDLKRKLACGGTVKGDKIELQGDHKSKAKQVLVNIGFSEDSIDLI